MALSVKLDKMKKHVVITLPMERPRPSASGKSLVLATSRGCKSGEAVYRGKPIAITANAFIFVDQPMKPSATSKSRVKPRREGKPVRRPTETEDNNPEER